MALIYLYIVEVHPDWYIIRWDEQEERAQIVASYTTEAEAQTEAEARAMARSPFTVQTAPPTRVPKEIYDGDVALISTAPKRVWTWIEVKS